MEMFEKVVLKCDECGNRSSKQLEFDKENMTLKCNTCRSIFTLLDKTDKPDKLRKLIEQQSCDNKEAYERLFAMYTEQKDKTGEAVLKIDTAIGYISDIKADLQKLHQEVASQGEDLKRLDQKATSQSEDLKKLSQKATSQSEDLKRLDQKATSQSEDLKRLNQKATSQGEDLKRLDQKATSQSEDLKRLNQKATSQGEDLKKLSQNAASQGEDLKRLNQKAFVQGEEIKKQGIKIDGVASRFDQETDNLRTLLREAMSEQYASGEKIKDIAKDLLTKDGNDFLANFCNAVYSDNAQKLNAFLDKIDEKQDKSDVELIIEFLINDLDSRNVSSLKNLVNKQNLQSKYLDKIEEEAEKVSEGIYNPKLKRDIFVAFSGKDVDSVVPIVNYFEEQGFTCYFSLSNLRHGKDAKENYWKELKTALENSKCVVFISSNNSRSQDCDALDELAYVEMLNNKPEFNIGMFEFILDDYSQNITKLMKDTLKEYFNDSTHYKDIAEISKKIFKYIQGIKLKRKFNIDEEKEVESNKIEQSKNVKQISSAQTNDLSVQAKTEVAATIEKDTKTADLSEANTKESNNTEILKTNVSPVSTITLSNYDKDEFEIEGTELVKYKGNKSKVFIPEGVTSIGWSAFKGCKSLTSIVIPSSVVSIANSAFDENSHTRYVSSGAFYGCSNLSSITVESSNPKYKSDGNCIIEKNTNKLVLGCKNSVIPNYVEKIESSAFSGCSSLTTIEIPNGVEEIGDEAFSDCSSLTSIVIPNSVILIDDEAFAGCSSLTNIVIHQGVENIGYDAFWGCSSLTSVVIPSSVTSIYDGAFSDCSSLKSIVILNGVEYIMDRAFEGCSSLTSVVIPGSVTSIGEGAFADCSSLKSIVIHSGVENIDDVAFKGCSNLTSIVIPSGIEKIGEYVFKDCNSLTIYCEVTEKPSGWDRNWNSSNRPVKWGYKKDNNIQSSKSNTAKEQNNQSTQNVTLAQAKEWCLKGDDYYFGKNGVIKDYEKAVYWYTKSAEQGDATAQYNLGYCYYYGEGVAKDLQKAVNWYTKSAEQRDATAQYNLGYCYQYGQGVAKDLQKAMYWYSKSAEQENARAQNNLGCCYYYGQGVAEDLQKAVYWYTKSAEQEYADAQYNLGVCYESGQGVAKDLQKAVYWYTKAAEQGHANAKLVLQKQSQMVSENKKTSVPKITLSNYDKKEFEIVGKELTKYKGRKKEIVIPYGVTRIGDNAFEGYSRITSIEIPNSITSIGDAAFCNCNRLTNIEIPSSVVSIGEYVFFNCSSLTSVVISNNITHIHYNAFRNCSSLKNIKIPSNVTIIGDSAFKGCSSLTNVVIPRNVTIIGDSAFDRCSSLTSVVIPSGVEDIGEHVFSSCSNLTSITVESSNLKYKSDGNCIIEKDTNKLVLGCNNSVIPNYVTRIGKCAFEGCSSLTKILIPKSVTNIDWRAFSLCLNLTVIEYEGTKKSWKEINNKDSDWKMKGRTINCLDGKIKCIF